MKAICKIFFANTASGPVSAEDSPQIRPQKIVNFQKYISYFFFQFLFFSLFFLLFEELGDLGEPRICKKSFADASHFFWLRR